MKKETDYNKTEKWLSENFKQVEKNIKYGGGALNGRTKRTNTRRGGFFGKPAVQIAGAFLLAAFVGGGTFGALKYMEYRGGNVSGSHGGDDTVYVTENTAENTVNKNAVFGGVTVIDLYGLTDGGVSISDTVIKSDVNLPIENAYKGVYYHKSEKAEALGYRLYTYYGEGRAYDGGLCVLDADGALVLNFAPQEQRVFPNGSAKLIYAAQSPSSHPVIFFTATRNYGDKTTDDNEFYVFDTVTGALEKFSVISLNEKSDGKTYRDTELSYDEKSGNIIYSVMQKELVPVSSITLQGASLSKPTTVYTDRIIWNGSSYALENPYEEKYENVTSDLTAYDSPAFDYSDKLADLQKASYEDDDPDGFVYVLTDGSVNPVFVDRLPIKKDGENKTAEEYDLLSLTKYNTFIFGGDLRLYNNVEGREMNVRAVHVCRGTEVTDFTAVEEAEEYLASMPDEYMTAKVIVIVSWDDFTKTENPALYAVSFTIYKDDTTSYQIKEEYKQINNSENCRYFAVYSNGRYVYPAIGLQTTKVRVSKDNTSVRSWGPHIRIKHVAYGDDFEIVNNVKDKDWTEISIRIRKDLSHTAYQQVTLQELYEYLKNAEAGEYEANIEFSWDESWHENVGDVYARYKTIFIISKSSKSTENKTDYSLFRKYLRYLEGYEEYYEDYIKYYEGKKNAIVNYNK